jgi:hypothetical protein
MQALNVEKKVRKEQVYLFLEHEDWKKFRTLCLGKDKNAQAVIETFVKFFIDRKGDVDDLK